VPLKNYRDLSVGGSDVGAGFQFQFYCGRCERQWKSAFKPFRMGQLTGLLTRFSYLVNDLRSIGRATGNFADMGARTAREKAFADAQQQAETRFAVCPGCSLELCTDCFDTELGRCHACLEELPDACRPDAADAARPCGECGAPSTGGRFCAECGSDTAAGFKACPACATQLPRQARFCTDCGHAC